MRLMLPVLLSILGARRRIADATAAKEAAEAKLLELESIDKDEFRLAESAVSWSLTGVGCSMKFLCSS